MTTHRLQEILDAYGADPARWPAEERDAAAALLARTPALRTEAARLDALLDATSAVDEPSPALVARVLAAAPARRRARIVRFPVVAAAASLAAAAGLVVWLAGARGPSSQPGVSLDDLGTYATATDVLLGPLGWDVIDTEPALGCSQPGTLGCPPLDDAGASDSTSAIEGSVLA